MTLIELVQLLGHLLERQLVDVDDDRDARESRHLGDAHGEGFDVEAATGEQPRDAGQQTGLVLDEEAQHVGRHGSVLLLERRRVVARVLDVAVADALRHHRPHHRVGAHDEVDDHRAGRSSRGRA